MTTTRTTSAARTTTTRTTTSRDRRLGTGRQPQRSEADYPSTRPRTPGALTDQIEQVIDNWATSQYELVMLAAEFADSPEWILTGSPTPAHWLAIIADVEPCTAREWPSR